MPAYELFLLIRNMPRPNLVKVIKKTAERIIENKGIIRNFENLGYKQLPYRMRASEGLQTTGNYILIKFDAPRDLSMNVAAETHKNKDFMRTYITPLVEYDETRQVECKCKESGEFAKNAFNFFKPMTSWDKRRVYKDYGRRL